MKFSAKEIATVSAMTAVLIGAQFLLSGIPGVEAVTALLLCFCYSFGAARGVLTATAFSLLCGVIHGFDVKSFVLYFLYYNLFALLFGLLGRKDGRKTGRKTRNTTDNTTDSKTAERTESKANGGFVVSIVVTELLFIALAGSTFLFRSHLLPHISRVLRGGLAGLSWWLFFLAAAGAAIYNAGLVLSYFFRVRGKEKYCVWSKKAVRLAAVVVLAAVCTILFTLLDDLLYPLFYGAWGQTAIAYFYSSFPFMIPQTICTVVTVAILFLPLTKIFDKAAKNMVK